jgi:hypothetical protein
MSTALIVTTISPPTEAMHRLAEGCVRHGWDFIVAGDTKSPADFLLDGCRFLSIAAQQSGRHRLGRAAPEKSYTRKNLAYLEAIAAGAEVMVETDDDNLPLPAFWQPRERVQTCRPVEHDGWVNAYRYFSDDFIYPRGLPLPRARDEAPAPGAVKEAVCPVQQGLADADPDVDAVFRMLFPGEYRFHDGHGPVLLRGGAWCPFNSQNTTFFREAFPLLYLPAHCSFRMTDIWRGFIALRILTETGHGLLFHGPTVVHRRNDHNLHRDFMDEVPGYSHNDRMRDTLLGLSFPSGASIRRMLELCYETLIREGWIGAAEEGLLAAWCDDLDSLP